MTDRACSSCGDQTQGMNSSGLCNDCEDWREAPDWEEPEERFYCQCRYCFCHADVELYGDTCGDCRGGGHQG